MLFRKSVAVFSLLATIVAATPTFSENALDPREPAFRTSEEQLFVLGQMRLFLETITAIQDDLAKGDMAGVARDAAPRDAREFSKVAKPPHLAEKETDAWKQSGRSLRLGFDDIADKARAAAGKDEILGALAKTMQNCVACHQTYRIVVKGE